MLREPGHVLNRYKLWLILLVTSCVSLILCARLGGAAHYVAPAPVFVADEPQAVYVYSADSKDPWNRIFRVLFTSTFQVRVSDAFPEHAPFDPFYVRMGSFPIRLSRMPFSRFELGDRAIEPVYPAFFTNERPRQVLFEQAFTELTTALQLAIDEKKTRSPIERALMQADVWAAYDIIYEKGIESGVDPRERKPALLSQLRRFIRKLALTSEEIKTLRNNYLDAVSGSKLPNLFSIESGWLEIELLPQRSHDHAADYRRATRVFVKARTKPANPRRFVESLKYNKHHDQIEAVALVIQNLLIDTAGRVVPSPVFTEAQFRFYKNDPNKAAVTAEPQQFELSRRKLLTEPASGGFVEYSATSPAFLTTSGNDFGFASWIDEADAVVVVPLRVRCTQCHNPSLTTIMTYSIHYIPPVPTTRVLNPLDQERARYVARRKEERDDFKSLISGR
jgi:hypothetical protein